MCNACEFMAGKTWIYIFWLSWEIHRKYLFYLKVGQVIGCTYSTYSSVCSSKWCHHFSCGKMYQNWTCLHSFFTLHEATNDKYIIAAIKTLKISNGNIPRWMGNAQDVRGIYNKPFYMGDTNRTVLFYEGTYFRKFWKRKGKSNGITSTLFTHRKCNQYSANQ